MKSTAVIYSIIVAVASLLGIASFVYFYSPDISSAFVSLESSFFTSTNSLRKISDEFSFTAPDISTPPLINKKPWGAYVGWQTSDLTEFTQKIEQAPQLVAYFIHWGNENDFPKDFASHLDKSKQTLIIFWEAMDYNDSSLDQPKFSYDAILRGDWDKYFTSFAASAKNYAGPIIIIPFEEANGNWYPWSITAGTNNATKHIASYRYIRKFFNQVPNVKFGWAINAYSVPDSLSNRYERFYPGDAYVDYVGIDGFNFGDPWMSFNQIFSDALNRLSKYHKPLYIFSMASAPGTRKASWIKDALQVQIPSKSQITGWVWFNENKEKDWRIWSDNDSLKAFKSAIKN